LYLNFEGKTTPDPTPAEIARAIPRARVPEEWTIEVVGDDGISIEADPAPEAGRFRVALVEGRRLFDAERPLDAAELEKLLVAFTTRDTRWRRLVRWRSWAPPKPPARRSWSVWHVIAALGLLAAAFGAALWFHFPA
jgi:hypothetical protein